MTKKQLLFISGLLLSIGLCAKLIHLGQLSLSVIEYQPEGGELLTNRAARLAYLGIIGVYLVWLFQTKSDRQASSFTNLLNPAGIFGAIAWLGYPLTRDIYLYLHYGTMSLSGANPYVVPAGSFDTALTPWLDWDQTSTYGIISLSTFIAAAKVASIRIFLGVYFFKLICLLVHTLNAYLIWKILKNSVSRSKITLAYWLNPALLFEQVTNAHVDVFICTVLIALDQLLKHRAYFVSLMTIGVGFLTKTVPIIWLPLEVVFLIRYKRWQTLICAAVIFLIGAALLYFTVLPNPQAWISLFNPGVGIKTSGSLHNLVVVISDRLLTPALGQSILTVFRLLTYLAFAVYYGWTLLKIAFKPNYSETNLLLDIGWITFVLFLFATPWYQPWYPTILLPIVALNAQFRFFALAVLVFCLSSTAMNFVLAYDQTLRGFAGTLITMGSTIGVLLLKSRVDRIALAPRRSP